MSTVGKRRWKVALAVVIGLVLVVDVVVIRWVLKRKSRSENTMREVAAERANQPETAPTTDVPPRPVRPVFSVIPALSFDEKEGARENIDHLGHWNRNTWVRYNAVDFGEGVSSVVAEILCQRQYAGRILSFHIDARDGPVVAELTVPGTQGFEAITAPVQTVKGVHDVFLTCSDGGINLRSIKFVRPQAATNLIPATSFSVFKGINEPRPGVVGNTDGGDWIKYDQIDFGAGVSTLAVDLAIGDREAKLVFRLDALDGPVIATLIPKSTGDWNTFQIQECPVQSASGLHDLYVTFEGARGLPDLQSIQFKAAPAR